TRRAEEYLVRVGPHDLDPGPVRSASRDEEASERAVQPERDRGECPLRGVAAPLERSDPEISRVSAVHVRPPGEDGIALDRLCRERFAGGLPVAEVARLEVKVERPTLGVRRKDAIAGGARGGRCGRRQRAGQDREQGG